MPQVHFGDQSLEVRHLERRGALASAALRGEGFDEGSVIAVVLRNEPAFIEALTCIRCLLAVRVLVPWHLRASEMNAIFSRVKPRVVLAHREFLPVVRQALMCQPNVTIVVVDMPEVFTKRGTGSSQPSINLRGCERSWSELVSGGETPLPILPGLPSRIGVSSGSTGEPKIVRHAAKRQWGNTYSDHSSSRPSVKSSIVTAPLFHGAQYGAFSQAWFSDADIVILPRFDALSFLGAVERYCVNHVYAVPTMFVRLLRLPYAKRVSFDVSSVNYVLQTGSLCPQEVKRRMIEWLGPVIWEAYGSTELRTISVASSDEWLERPGTVGIPMRDVAIVDDGGEIAPPGDVGEVFVDVSSTPTPEFEGQRAITNPANGCKLVSAGDSGYLDKDGYLFLLGRADGLINTGRVKMFPIELESELLKHPKVTDCVVFGLLDEEFGQHIGAAIEVTEGSVEIEAEVREYLTDRISAAKLPTKMWFFTESLRRESGKFCLESLRRRVSEIDVS